MSRWARPEAASRPIPIILVLGQDDNERIMGEKLNELGVSVEWNTELLDFTQNAEGVVATLKLPDGGEQEAASAFIAGCDGAHSAVRKGSGIGFPGEAYEHVFFVADVVMTGTMVPGQVNVYLWRRGFHLLFPMRGKDHWRIVGIVPEELRAQDDLDARRGAAVTARRGRVQPVDRQLQLVFDLPHPSPRRRALPARAAPSCSATPRISTARSARRA